MIRAQAAALELRADDIAARCQRCAIEAEQAVAIRAPQIRLEATSELRACAPELGLEATLGDLSLRANDDVRVLGEKILLNCDRDPPVPSWISAPTSELLLPRSDAQGDPGLLSEAFPSTVPGGG